MFVFDYCHLKVSLKEKKVSLEKEMNVKNVSILGVDVLIQKRYVIQRLL